MSTQTKRSQGAEAVRQGEENRSDVHDILFRNGWERINLSAFAGPDAVLKLIQEQDAPRLDSAPPGVFAQEVALGRSVYETDMREDFLLYRPGWKTALVLAARHQNSSGSAREKLEYLFANINERFPCPCMVILEGPELEPVRKRAREWVGRSKGQLAEVFDGVQDFRRWVTAGCVYPTPPSTLGI